MSAIARTLPIPDTGTQPSERPVEARSTAVPWYVWCGILAVTSSSIGMPWDISWHRTIGRDTFWTPPHMAILACGVLAAITCVYVIMTTTFGRSTQMRGNSIQVFGLRAPLGVFVSAWGGLAMLTSTPFDNWWHEAYGLDVMIFSPPHVLLLTGLNAISIGIYIMLLGAMNRSSLTANNDAKVQQRLLLYVGGLVIVLLMLSTSELTSQPLLHLISSYKIIAMLIPCAFAFLSRTARNRWAATWCAFIYTAFVISQILVLPLFPATPALGPVYYPVTHLVPTSFPILIILPAIALDLLWQHTQHWKQWQVALVGGIVFTTVLIICEWHFANFLMSKWSENRFFGTTYFGYTEQASSYQRLRLFYGPSSGRPFLNGLLKAFLYGAVGIWIGMSSGNWMRKVLR